MSCLDMALKLTSRPSPTICSLLHWSAFWLVVCSSAVIWIRNMRVMLRHLGRTSLSIQLVRGGLSVRSWMLVFLGPLLETMCLVHLREPWMVVLTFPIATRGLLVSRRMRSSWMLRFTASTLMEGMLLTT